jgi:hypothetical protein
MVNDIEKADVESNKHVPQDFDGPVEHPGVSTSPDQEEKTDGDSIHSEHSHTSAGSIEHIPEEKEPAQRSKSKSSSVRSRPLSIVPRHKRRGLLGKLSLIPEVDRPYDYKRSTKWLITLLVALAAAAAPMGSSIFLRKCWLPSLSSI